MSSYKAWCKATRGESSEPRCSANWVVARRAWFKVFPDGFECGSWMIPKAQVRRAIAYRTRQLLIPVTVLHLIRHAGSYQFGFNPWARPIENLGIQIETQQVKLKCSAFSIVVRVAGLGYIMYWVWSTYLKN